MDTEDVQIAAPVIASCARIWLESPACAMKKTRPLAASTDAALTSFPVPTYDHATPPLAALIAYSVGVPAEGL